MPATDETDNPNSWSRLAFKQVVGTAIGAVTVGATLGAISLYRDKTNPRRALQAALGGALFGGLGFVGFGGEVYDETIGRWQKRPSLAATIAQQRSSDRTR